MERLGIKSLWQIVRKHPWSSFRDAALIGAFMVFVVLLARHYDLFTFLRELAQPAHKVSSAETALIALLFGICVALFVARRLEEGRCDVAYERRLEREITELRELAMHDPLTNLPNRRVLLTALDRAIESSGERKETHAFFLMDLNGFKSVNDAYGHAVGDEVLQLVVDRFKRVARPTDLLARIGGDEFGLLSFNVDREGAAAIASRYSAALQRAIKTRAHAHEVGVAIGIALIPAHGSDSATVLRHADVAMYRAKSAPGDAFVFFDDEVDAARAGRKLTG